MPRDSPPPLAREGQGITGRVLADLPDTASPAAPQADATHREQDRARALVWWILRQPAADLAEAAGRDWLAYSRAEMTLRIRVTDLRAQLAVAEMAHGLVLGALDEAAELTEGAALTHAHAREAVAA